MNNARRKRIKEAIRMLNEGFKLNDYDAIDYGRDIISDVLDDEQYSYDNIPESLQYSDRAERSYEAIELLEESYSMIEWLTETEFKNKDNINIKDAINNVICNLNKIL